MYNQNGNYVALAGVAVLLLAKFGVKTDVASIFTVVGGVVALVGIVKQFFAHRNLAVTAGAYPRE